MFTIKLLFLAKYLKYLYYTAFAVKSGVSTYKAVKWKWNFVKKWKEKRKGVSE